MKNVGIKREKEDRKESTTKRKRIEEEKEILRVHKELLDLFDVVK